MRKKRSHTPFWIFCRQSQIIEAHITPLKRLIKKLVKELECAHEMHKDFGAEIHVASFHAKWYQVLDSVEVSTGAFDSW